MHYVRLYEGLAVSILHSPDGCVTMVGIMMTSS